MRCNSRYFHRDVVEVCKYMMYLAHIAHMHSFKFLKTLRIFSTLRTAPRGARDTSGSRTQGRGGNNPSILQVEGCRYKTFGHFVQPFLSPKQAIPFLMVRACIFVRTLGSGRLSPTNRDRTGWGSDSEAMLLNGPRAI